MAEPLTYRNMTSRLIEAVPELRAAYDEERTFWIEEDFDPHNVYSIILVSYIVESVQSSGMEDPLRRVFGFLEGVATSSDEDAVNVLGVTVLEELLGWHEGELSALKTFMGPTTKQILADMEEAFDREVNPADG